MDSVEPAEFVLELGINAEQRYTVEKYFNILMWSSRFVFSY